MTRLDAELVRRQLARSRAQAAELVRAGRVSASGRVITKPSATVTEEDNLAVAKVAGETEYASRAAHKLLGALEVLPEFRRRIAAANALDLGASTGGFTEVLLRNGAAHVIALDVGHDQLLARLRTDPRVTSLEGVNARDLSRTLIGASPAVVVGDLSFISLRLVLGPLAAVADPQTVALLLVKPQFEVGRQRLGAGGVVRDPALHATAIREVAAAAAEHGWQVEAVVPSPLPGPAGNREFFLALSRPPDGRACPLPGLEQAILEAVTPLDAEVIP
ncbi:MAG: TlyA family RNA methyltransferase [Promicromonosporaceae bacterium]|nr:TlyA family RNA methyltransferase [Promicromonosporaceae bacterium]